MLTACGAPGQLWHVDQNPITTTRRDVGLGILALGVAVHIDVVDGSHKWEYEEREGTFHPTNAPAGTRWRRVHIPRRATCSSRTRTWYTPARRAAVAATR